MEVTVGEENRPSFTVQLSELVCPVCYEYMHPPIMLCDRGHSICELCHELMSECPRCKGDLTDRRSSHLEALTAIMKFPCRRCKNKFYLRDLTSHDCTADILVATCIIGQVYGDCMWSGPATDMLKHCRVQHSSNFWTGTTNIAKWQCSDLSSIGIQNVFVVDITGAMFVIVQKYDSVGRSLQWNLSCECDNEEQYLYEIHLFCSASSHVSVTSTPVENELNIMTFFPSSNEIIIPMDKAYAFLNDNVLQYKVIIRKRCNVVEDVNVVATTKSLSVLAPEDTPVLNTGCGMKTWSSIVHIYNSVKTFLACKKTHV